MTSVAEIKTKSEINEKEFSQMTKFLYESFLIRKSRNSKSSLEKQGQILALFTEVLNKYLELQFLSDKKRKIEFINFIDKLNLQKEMIDLQKGVTNIDNIKIAANRLGRKSQSAFKTR
jgi:hypothetical protein